MPDFLINGLGAPAAPRSNSETSTHPNDGVAAVLYATTTPQTEMYPVEKALESTFRNHNDAVIQGLGLTETQRKEREDEHVALVRETGLDPYTAGKTLYEAMTRAELATARGETVPDAQALAERARAALAETYGQADSEALYARVEKFTKAHPKLKKLLSSRGIGLQVDVLTSIAEHVRNTNFR
jgi:hypothetical protein